MWEGIGDRHRDDDVRGGDEDDDKDKADVVDCGEVWRGSGVTNPGEEEGVAEDDDEDERDDNGVRTGVDDPPCFFISLTWLMS